MTANNTMRANAVRTTDAHYSAAVRHMPALVPNDVPQSTTTDITKKATTTDDADDTDSIVKPESVKSVESVARENLDPSNPVVTVVTTDIRKAPTTDDADDTDSVPRINP